MLRDHVLILTPQTVKYWSMKADSPLLVSSTFTFCEQ